MIEKKDPTGTLDETRVRERAYYLWLAGGMQPGHHGDHWYRAISEIQSENLNIPVIASTENVALHKPALQSSVWQHPLYHDKPTETDVANNGDTESPIVFHTSLETNPWWKVDLQNEFIVESIVIWNRLDLCLDRLNKFSILMSTDGTAWTVVHSKEDEAEFEVYKADFGEGCVTRFVQIRLDGQNYLHFRECQVFARPVDERG